MLILYLWLRGLAGALGGELITPCTDKSDKDTAVRARSSGEYGIGRQGLLNRKATHSLLARLFV